MKRIVRIAIWGPPCSGKSTLAVKIGKHLDIPVHHSDAIFLGEKEDNSLDYLHNKAIQILNEKQWVIDGNFGELREEVIARSKIIIILDLPLSLLVIRLIKRTISAYTPFKLTPSSHFHKLSYKNWAEVIRFEIYDSFRLMVSFKRNYLKYLVELIKLLDKKWH